MNSRKFHGRQSRLATTKSVSTPHKYNFASEERIQKLKEIHLKKKSETKIEWTVSAYTDWRNERLYNFQYDVGIYETDLNQPEKLTKENLQHTLCRFIPEVTKKRGEGFYPGAMLYQMVVAIQKYLFVKKLKWKLVEGDDFDEMRTVLDNIMQERTAANVGVVKNRQV